MTLNARITQEEYSDLPEVLQEKIEEQSVEDEELQAISNALKEADEAAPDLTTLKHWQSKFGQLYLSRVGDLEPLYVFRVLFRLEWKEMLGLNLADDYLRQESIVKKCLLYPEPTEKFIYGTSAGTLPSLEKQIMYQSGFVSEQDALRSISLIG